jgi:hypothetical protein
MEPTSYMSNKQSVQTRGTKLLAAREQFSLKRMINGSGTCFLVPREDVLVYLKKGWVLDYSQVNIYEPRLCQKPELERSDYHKMIQLKRISQKRSVEFRQSVLIEYLEKGWILGTPPALAVAADTRNQPIQAGCRTAGPLFKTDRVEVRVISM